ncbi:MAG: 16S rRNA (cytosine(967)-C(5))-methyltransferase RsmB [Acidobacteriota bacterium]
MAISPARISAYEILMQIETGRGFSSELLSENAERLEERDRSLCHELTLGVLRRQIYLDRIVAAFSGDKKADPEITIALRMGLYQLIYLDRVPAYSAIDDCVELVKRAKKKSASGFVNAILRRATREKAKIVFADDIDRISVETSHPRWLIEKWARDFGSEFAGYVAAANNDQPRTAFRLTARSQMSPSEALSECIRQESELSDVAVGCYLAERFSPRLKEFADHGMIYFQDEASQLVAGLVDIKGDGSFLDVCASPGGKTTQIAAGMSGRGMIAAGDLSEKRVEFLRTNCIAQGASNVEIVRYDAETDLPFARSAFDQVLVDAPCSGTGTIRHNPEIRYRLAQNDFPGLSARQVSILGTASNVVAPGGKLLYSTCSLEIEENETVVETFLAANSDFHLERPNVPDEFITADGFARTYPPRDNMDGFFVAVLRKAITGAA